MCLVATKLVHGIDHVSLRDVNQTTTRLMQLLAEISRVR
jgi:hypothetical protein